MAAKRKLDLSLSRDSVDSAGISLQRSQEILKDTEELLTTLKPLVLVSAADDDVEEEDEGSDEGLDLEGLLRQDRLLQWMQWCQLIESLEKQCLEAVDKDEVERSAAKFGNLVDVVLRLRSSRCGNLKARADAALTALHSRLAPTMAERMEKDLAKMNFPQCVLSEHFSIRGRHGAPTAPVLAALAALDPSSSSSDFGESKLRVRFCLLLEVAAAMESTGVKDISTVDPNEVLLKPFRKRFKFHFCGKKKTNNPVRPEWYLQQVKIWMRRSRDFYESCVFSASVSSFESQRHHAKFCRGLFVLVGEKLRNDLGRLIEDDVLLSHAIDEILLFSKDINDMELAKNVPAEHLPINVLTEDDIFKRWLSLERKYAFEKMDSLLVDDEGWQESQANPEIFRCVETFVTLLQSLTSRFKQVLSSEVRLQFLDLQRDLLEDFRMRLVQVLRQETLPVSERYGLALNSAHHLVRVLVGWSEMPLFLHLHYLLCDGGGGEVIADYDDCGGGGGVFANAVSGFNFLIKDSIRGVARSVGYEVRAQSLAYRKSVNWMSHDVIEDSSPCAESLGMFQALSTNLNRVVLQSLNRELAGAVLDNVAREMADFFLQDVVLENAFNADGSRQLEVDVSRGLLPILRQFSSATGGSSAAIGKAASTQRLEEALKLLRMNRANAALLHDSLSSCGDNVNEAKEILMEMGVTSLSGSTALKILGRRTDLPSY